MTIFKRPKMVVFGQNLDIIADLVKTETGTTQCIPAFGTMLAI